MMAAASHTSAQEELDNVVGREKCTPLLVANRSCVDITAVSFFGDQEMLPQVTAFILESLR